jgi:hypothetical protein
MSQALVLGSGRHVREKGHGGLGTRPGASKKGGTRRKKHAGHTQRRRNRPTHREGEGGREGERDMQGLIHVPVVE